MRDAQRGLSVVVLGPDGAGKSTIIEMLAANPPVWTKGVVLRHLKPSNVPNNSVVVSDPHGRAPRGLASSVAKCFYWLAEYTVGYNRHVEPDLKGGKLVLFDRYLLDVLVDPRRYRYGGPAWLMGLLWRVVPKPDLIVLLDAPAEVLWARKQEVELDEVRRQMVAYRALVSRQPQGHLVDVSGAPEAVVRQMQDLIDAAALPSGADLRPVHA